MCKEITNRLQLQGGFTMVFLLTLVYLHTRLHFTTAYKNWNKRIIWLWARILPYGPSPGTAANYNMGSQLWKKLLNPCYSLYTLSLKYVHLIFLLLVVTGTVFDTWVICPWRGTAWRPRFLSMSVTLKKKNTIIMDVCIWLEFWLLNSYTLTSVCIFSILFSLNFSRCRQGEFVKQSRAFSVGKHFLYDCDLKVWLWGDTVRRN